MPLPFPSSGDYLLPQETIGKENAVRAMDCSDPGTHEDVHFTAETDDELFQKIQQHRDDYHQEMSDDEIKQMISSDAYDE